MSPSAALRCAAALLAYWSAQGFINNAAPHSKKPKWAPITAGLPYKFEDVDLDEAATRHVKMREADGGSLQNMSKDCSARRPHFFTPLEDCGMFISEDECKRKRGSPTYLASYPGSGNTWTRVVLEGTLRIYSGSVFSDLDLYREGMRGEGNVNSEEVFPIKTHWPTFGRHLAVGWNLCILRDPLHAALSWTSYNVGGGNHSFEAGKTLLRRVFNREIVQHLNSWKHAAETYRNCANCLVVRFEDIVANTRETYLQEILPYLGVDITRTEVSSRLDCSIERSNANHDTRRTHSYTFEFTLHDRELAREIVGVELAMHFGYALQ